MAKLVFFCIPAQGHTNPTLGVVRELVLRGHSVWYYSYRVMQAPIEAAGAVFVPCDGYDQKPELSKRAAAQVGRDLALSLKLLVDSTLALDEMLCAGMARLKPDCIVADSMAVWGKLVAKKLGIPFVSSTTTFAFNRHSAKIIRQSPGDLFRLLLSWPRARREIRRLQRRGYPLKGPLDILQNDSETHTIVYTSPEFQPCAETFSEKYAFVGPSIRPAGAPVAKTRDRLIYISMGTVNNDLLPLYRSCIAALGDTGYQVILSVGNAIGPEALGPLPEAVSVFPQVDQIAVLEQADVFLSHCGMNSVNESLYFSVPLLMLPQTPEQAGVAARVEQLGAGRMLARTDPASIRAGVEAVLAEARYRKNAAAIAQGFRRCPGPAGAADKILQVCGAAEP